MDSVADTGDGDSWALEMLRDIGCELRDGDCVSTTELSLGGGEFAESLLALAEHPEQSKEYDAILMQIVNAAHSRMLAYHHCSVPICWRRLYSDASLIWSLLDLARINNSSERIWKDAVSRLDHAIVITGAPGKGRLDLILDTIERIQQLHLPLRPPNLVSNTPKTICPSSESRHLFSSARSIPCLAKVPSISTFQAKFATEPFILRKFALDWPALTNTNDWSSKDYLLRVSGRGRVVPVEVGRDYREDDWTSTMMEWETFLDYMFSSGVNKSSSKKTIYLAQHDLLKQFPRLRSDILVPDYVYAALSPPEHFSEYRSPNNDESIIINAWFGPKHAVTPAHLDPYFNLYTQVVGRKTVWVAPPQCSPVMSRPGSLPLATPSTSDRSYDHSTATKTQADMLSNTSHIDVFAPLAVPSFETEVVPHAMSATLEPGDMLFFPPGWWHAMRSEDMSFSVSMWF